MDGTSALSRQGREGTWVLPALFLGAALAFTGLFPEHGLWFPDEPRVAGIGREMFDKGSFFLPLLGGRPFLEKPPLYWWAQMGSFSLFGVHPWSARLPSALFSLLAMAAAFAMGRKLSGGKGGFLAVGVLGTTLLFCQTMYKCLVDPALVFALSWAHYGLLCLHVPSSERERKAGLFLASFFLPLAFLAKGVVGIGLGLGPFLLYLLARRRFREILSLGPFFLLLAGLFLVLAGGWAWGLYREGGPEALKECLLGNTIGRFLGTTRKYGHLHSPLFYAGTLVGRFMPWTLALPALFSLPPAREEGERREAWFTLAALVGFGLLLLSLASSKRSLYLLPLLPALAALLGGWLLRTGREERSLDRLTMKALLLLSWILPPAVFLFFLLCPLLPGKDPFLDRCRALFRPGILLASGTAVLAWTCFLGWKVLPLLRSRRRPGPLAVLLPLVMVLLALKGIQPPLLEPLKSAHHVSKAVKGFLERGEEGALFQPRESLRGLLYFDLQRSFPELSREETLPWLKEGGRRFLLVEERKLKRLPREIREETREVWRGGGKKPFVILKSRS